MLPTGPNLVRQNFESETESDPYAIVRQFTLFAGRSHTHKSHYNFKFSRYQHTVGVSNKFVCFVDPWYKNSVYCLTIFVINMISKMNGFGYYFFSVFFSSFFLIEK